jgi:hypothetical protein
MAGEFYRLTKEDEADTWRPTELTLLNNSFVFPISAPPISAFQDESCCSKTKWEMSEKPNDTTSGNQLQRGGASV